MHREALLAQTLTKEFGVSHPGLEAPMVTLSGGNQQKAILARWLQTDPTVCILDEPTKGVDIGARAALHRHDLARASQGMAILLISSDLPELLGLAHRVLVLHKGRLVAELAGTEVDPAAGHGTGFHGPRRMTISRLSPLGGAGAVAGDGDLARLYRLRTALRPVRRLDNLRNVLLQAAPTVIATVGMTFVIATRGIDLSIGSILNLALCAAVTLAGTQIEAELNTQTTALVYPVALATGLILGVINAQLIIWLRLSPLIVTLGTLTLYRGLAQHLTSAALIAVSGPVLWFGRAQFYGIALPVIAAAWPHSPDGSCWRVPFRVARCWRLGVRRARLPKPDFARRDC